MPDAPHVPLLDLKAQYATIRRPVRQAVERVLDGQQFILGPEVAGLEKELADYCEAGHAVGCASGSDALLIALMAFGVGRGDQVVCPAYTFFATAGSIARLGAEPVFADIDPATYNLDAEQARRAAERCDRLRAIVPVHLFGRAADVDAFRRLGEQLGVPVVEDAAQAIGARDARGRRVGGQSSVGCFSFFPSKNLGGYGDGGLLTTNDAERAEHLRALREHGSRDRYLHPIVGLNSRLDELQAAVLRVKLRHLEDWSEARRTNAAHYDGAFAAQGARPSSVPLEAGGLPLRTPLAPPGPALHVYNQYVIRVPADRRDALREHLTQRGIGTAVYYPLGLHLQACFASLGHRTGDLPETERACRETLALPIYAELTRAQREHVIAAILEFLGG
jgi:dTDP-4-amino-4,6-dideoxygalactose transaminase